MAEKQESQKKFLGMLMSWDRKNMFKKLWNAESDELFPPKSFGIGWTVNFHALLRAAGVIKKAPRQRK